MMKITGLSHLLKWENLHNWWLTKYFFAPLYICYAYKLNIFTYNIKHKNINKYAFKYIMYECVFIYR